MVIYLSLPLSPSVSDNARLRRKSIATGRQPSMETPPIAPPQPFRQSVSTPRLLLPSLSLSLSLSRLLDPSPARPRARRLPPIPHLSLSLYLSLHPFPALFHQKDKSTPHPSLPLLLLSFHFSFFLFPRPLVSHWESEVRRSGSTPVWGRCIRRRVARSRRAPACRKCSVSGTKVPDKQS